MQVRDVMEQLKLQDPYDVVIVEVILSAKPEAQSNPDEPPSFEIDRVVREWGKTVIKVVE